MSLVSKEEVKQKAIIDIIVQTNEIKQQILIMNTSNWYHDDVKMCNEDEK